MTVLCAKVLRIIAASYDLPAEFFDDKMDKHTSILSLNHFPVTQFGKAGDGYGCACNPINSEADRQYNSECTNADPELIRIADHTDISMITIVLQSQPGLQILHPSSLEWVDVPFLSNSLIVNIGDCLRDWSSGRLKSTRHRVVSYSYPNLSLPPSDEVHKPAPADTENIRLFDSSGIGLASPSSISGRLSIAYFVGPNYDAQMSWTHENNSTGLTYSKWRKQRIAQSMTYLKKS
jgi:isopenicillin N synthase-like dioxygenase